MPKRCPFCGEKPEWFDKEYRGTMASGMEPHERALGCTNKSCPAKPRTKWRATGEWSQERGHYPVDYDLDAIKDWDTRATPAQILAIVLRDE